jgi:DNA-binding NtrC family response regulator
MNVLLIDDEHGIRLTLGDALEDAGHAVRRAANLAEGRMILAGDFHPDCVITDLCLPDGSGLDILAAVREKDPHTALLVITAHQSIETAITATKHGADYLIKPFLNEEVLARLNKIEEMLSLKAEVRRLRSEVGDRYRLDRLVGRSPCIREVFKTIETIGPSDATVLIHGESGTGKELAAQALHTCSPRRVHSLVKISCAALPENLLEDELFGHEKGAFTGAGERKPGCFERAEGGTIFFDDIDDMSLATQVKLLRVLQERTVSRLGGGAVIPVNVRIVSAVKTDLSHLVRRGAFRDDLYFRLRVVELRLPPLRERPEDIPLLIEHFIRQHGGGRDFRVAPETIAQMFAYNWPGNVRELENSILRAVALAGESRELDAKHLLQPPAAMNPEAADQFIPRSGGTLLSPGIAPAIQNGAPPPATHAAPAVLVPLKTAIQETERKHIRTALSMTNGNRQKAADLLGISRKKLWEKMKEYGEL